MAAHASVASPEGADGSTGYLFAIRKPVTQIAVMDARSYGAISTAMSPTDMYWYRPPDVSERLRIQRGSFVMGHLDAAAASRTIPLSEGTSPDWLAKRMDRMGQKNAVKS